jgi:hypothetical protein
MTHQEQLVEEFYQHMLKSTPVLDEFERASLKLKVQELLTTALEAKAVEVEKLQIGELGKEGTAFYGTAAARQYAGTYNQAITDALALIRKP